MIITELLEKNAKIYPNDVSLVEINPEQQPDRAVTWREYNLIEGLSGFWSHLCLHSLMHGRGLHHAWDARTLLIQRGRWHCAASVLSCRSVHS